MFSVKVIMEDVAAVSDTVVLGFGHVRTECYQEVSEDLTSCCCWEFCVRCHVICFYVVPVNNFSISGCRGESEYSVLHNRCPRRI